MRAWWIGVRLGWRECNDWYVPLKQDDTYPIIRDNLNDIFHTNVTSVHHVTQAFLPLLRKGEKKVVINMWVTNHHIEKWQLTKSRSTTLGSFAKAEVYRQSPTPAYKISKAALNMLTVQYAQQYEADGFTFLAITPGVSPLIQPTSLLTGEILCADLDSGYVPTSVVLEQICPWRLEQRRFWILCNRREHIRMGSFWIFMYQDGRMRPGIISMLGRR
jgi:NAD(P)-dependent dehydrogenase (short-subunit alcohol dehydrogenase family)